MSLKRHLSRETHVHRFAVVASHQHGWDVIEEEDSMVLTTIHRNDWHRVEQDIQRFALAAVALKRAGWVERDVTGADYENANHRSAR
jgi:hypothetical protein